MVNPCFGSIGPCQARGGYESSLHSACWYEALWRHDDSLWNGRREGSAAVQMRPSGPLLGLQGNLLCHGTHLFSSLGSVIEQATSAGQKDLEAQNMLEKKLKSGTSISYDETVQMAISVLQSVLSADFKASDIEVNYHFLP